MGDYQLSYEADYIFKQCLHFEDGERVIERIKQMFTHPPSALLVTSDEVVGGIVTCAQTQLFILATWFIGFNNQPIAKMMNITTIEIPLVEIGRKLFLQGLSDTKEPPYQEIPVTLIEGKPSNLFIYRYIELGPEQNSRFSLATK